MQEGHSATNPKKPYVVDTQIAVASESRVSRLRVIPVANHKFSSMGNKDRHRKCIMGGASINFVHRDSDKFLCIQSDGDHIAVSLSSPSEFTGSELVAHSWCIMNIDLEWSGATQNGDRTCCLKHSQTDLFLQCREDGSLHMSSEYQDKSCHFRMEIVDSDDVIMYEIDSFCEFRTYDWLLMLPFQAHECELQSLKVIIRLQTSFQFLTDGRFGRAVVVL